MNYFLGALHDDSGQFLQDSIKQVKRHAKWRDCRFTTAIVSQHFNAGYLSLPASNSAHPSEIYNPPNCKYEAQNICIFDKENLASQAATLSDSDNILQQISITNSLQAQLETADDKKHAKCLNAIQGDFRLIYSNSKYSSVLLAVSPFNPKTLFYAQLSNNPSTCIVSDNLELILLLLSPKADITSLALWLSGRPDPNRSMFSNIHQVPQACIVHLHSSGLVLTNRFWDIDPHKQLNKVPFCELRDQLKHTITQSISQSIADTPKRQAVFTQLSGGMDSTTVSVLALQLAKQNNINLHTVSHMYPNTESCDESANIEAMLERHTFAKSHVIELEKYTKMSFGGLYPTHIQNPGIVMSPKYYEEAMLVKSYGANLMLTGNGGDEMFWGHSLTYYDRLKRGDIKVVSELIKAVNSLKLPMASTLRSVFLRPFLQYDLMPFVHLANRVKALQKGIGKPPWLTTMAKGLVEQTSSLINPFSDKHAELAKFARYDGMFNTSTFNSMRSYQAVFDEFNLKVAHPLFSKELAEFSFAIPQKMHISGQYPKLFLRQTMNSELPEQVCWNKHKIVFDQHFAKLVKQNRTSLRLLLQHTGLADLGLLNNKLILSVFDNVVNQQVPSINVDLLYAILVQSWYQTHIEQ